MEAVVVSNEPVTWGSRKLDVDGHMLTGNGSRSCGTGRSFENDERSIDFRVTVNDPVNQSKVTLPCWIPSVYLATAPYYIGTADSYLSNSLEALYYWRLGSTLSVASGGERVWRPIA